jgi:hypothetical protein
MKKNKNKGRRVFTIVKIVVGRLFLFIFGLLGIVAFTLLILLIRYKQWDGEKSEFLDNIVNQEYSEEQKTVLEESLLEFQSSGIERENLRLTRDDFEILLIQAINENNGDVVINGIEMVTLNRSFDLYYKQDGYPWMIIRSWQRQDGSLDFIIYDVKVGPISLSTFSWGWISSQFSMGVQDSMDIVFSENFSGRKIEEIYVFDNCIRFVLVMDEE